MNTPKISRRGVYYDLEISPYRFTTPNGEILKFSSEKKLEIYTRKVEEYERKIDKQIEKHSDVLGDTWVKITKLFVKENMYNEIYDEVQG